MPSLVVDCAPMLRVLGWALTRMRDIYRCHYSAVEKNTEERLCVAEQIKKSGIQADRILCLCKILAYSPFWESQTVHHP